MKITEITAKQFQAKLKDPVLFNLKAKIKELRKQVKAYDWQVRVRAHKDKHRGAYYRVILRASDPEDSPQRAEVYRIVVKILADEIAKRQVGISQRYGSFYIDIDK